MGSPFRKRTVFILPAVLLIVSLLQDIASYKVRQQVGDVNLRVAIAIALSGTLFAVAADWVSPWIQKLLTSVRTGSRREGGKAGLFFFYVIAYGAIYWAYLIAEKRGVGALLPPSFR